MEKDLLISRPLFDARSFVEPVSIVEPRGELNSAGSLVLNSADNTSSPGDSGVPAEPLISGGNIESLAARDWRCSEENFLVGNFSAGVMLGQFRYNLGWLLIFLRNLTRLLL